MSRYNFLFLFAVALSTSCSTIDKASSHGFTSGYYKLGAEKKQEKVYVDISDEMIDVYHQSDNRLTDEDKFLSIPVNAPDGPLASPLKFKRQSLDIDITTILLKYRPAVPGSPPQLNTDLNFALYAGWRHDSYKITGSRSPLGKGQHHITNLGFDLGFFTGAGATPVNPFTTNNRTGHDYSGMIVQMGIAGFFESSMASFGVAAGFDHLLNRDREIWIYNKKPWVGFVVGVALN
ncbi:MAG: hypothetical protein RI973_2373 [Bacteroidota bacterium]